MPALKSANDILKDHIEEQIKKDSEEGLDLASAEALLGVTSVEKEYAAMKKRAAASLFVFTHIGGLNSRF